MRIKVYGLLFFIVMMFIAFTSELTAETFYVRDPKAEYDEGNISQDVVTAIPGCRLDPENALKIRLDENDYGNATEIDPEIMIKADKYIKMRKISKKTLYSLYAAKNINEYLLLYFSEEEIMDGGFELIYSKKLDRIIGRFIAGYKG